jgi:parallel beta-helix repeat protein
VTVRPSKAVSLARAIVQNPPPCLVQLSSGRLQEVGLVNYLRSHWIGHAFSICFPALIVISFCLNATAQTNNYYVSPTGSDSGDGSQARPWKTLQHASSALSLGASGTIVHFAPGNYSFSTFIFVTRSGTEGARITYQSDTPQAAHFIWACGQDSCFIQGGDYVDIIGFDFTGPTTGGMGLGIDFGKGSSSGCNAAGVNTPNGCGYANFNRFLNNVTHDVGTARVSPQFGASFAVSSGSHDTLVDGNVFKHAGIPNSLVGYGTYLAGYHNTVTNNIYADNTIGVHLYHNPCENVIANNTFVHNRVGGILIGGWATNTIGVPYCPTRTGDDYNSVSNNILVRNGSECGSAGHGAFGILLTGTGGNAGPATHNKVSDNYLADNLNASCAVDNSVQVMNAAAPITSGNINAGSAYNNLFVNYQDNGSGDYHLAVGSPAIRAGGTTSSTVCAVSPGITACIPTLDIDATIRPSSPSVGAYEFGGSAADASLPAPSGLTATVQ